MEYIDRGVSRKCDLDTISGKLSYVRKMDKYLRWIPDPAERELYVQRVAQRTGLPAETIHEKLGGGGAGRGREASPAENVVNTKESLPEESRLLQLFASDPSLAREAREEGVGALLTDGDAREVMVRLAALADRGSPGDSASLLTESLPDAIRNRLSAEMVRSEYPAGEARKKYPAAVRELRIRAREREIRSLQEQMKIERSEEGKVALLGRLLAATREKERLESERRSR